MASLNSRQSKWAWCFIQQPSQQTRLLQIPVSKVKTNLKFNKLWRYCSHFGHIEWYQYHYRNLHVHLDKHHHFITLFSYWKKWKLTNSWRRNFEGRILLWHWQWWDGIDGDAVESILCILKDTMKMNQDFWFQLIESRRLVESPMCFFTSPCLQSRGHIAPRRSQFACKKRHSDISTTIIPCSL